MKYNTMDIVTMARKRAQTYDTLIGIFMSLPDADFLTLLYTDATRAFLIQYKQLDHAVLSKGINLVLKFLDENKIADSDTLIEALAVDRTRLVRCPYDAGLRAPYENQYLKGDKMSKLLLSLKRTYQESGFIPVNTSDTMDFFCIQLDFLRVLTLKIIAEPATAQELLELERKFLNAHIGSWIKDYTKDAIQFAETDFYKGWLLFLEGFLDLENGYLNEIG